jgi:hypothetical protein
MSNARPEVSEAAGKARSDGKLLWRHQVTKAGCPIS